MIKTSGITGPAFAGTTAVTPAFSATQAFAIPSASTVGTARACTNRYRRDVACCPFYGYRDYARGICVCAG